MSYKILKPKQLLLTELSNISTKCSEDDLQASELPDTPMHSTGKVFQQEDIFDPNAKKWIMDNWHFRSANGSWSPRRSPIAIKRKIIAKRRKALPRAKIAAWMCNHLKALRIVHPERFKESKKIDMVLISRFVKATYKMCSRRSRQILSKAQSIYRA